jgi:hypothetical protein
MWLKTRHVVQFDEFLVFFSFLLLLFKTKQNCNLIQLINHEH